MKIANWKPFDPDNRFADIDIGEIFSFSCEAHLCLKVSETEYFDFQDNDLYDIEDIPEMASVVRYPDAELWPGFPKRNNF